MPTYFATLALTVAVMAAYAWHWNRPLDASVARLGEPKALFFNLAILGLHEFAAPYLLPAYGQAVMFEKSATFYGHDIWVLHNLGLALLLIPFVDHNVRTPSSRFDRTLGEMSYGLYLGHWCALLLFRERWQALDAGESVLELLLFVACSCAVGWLLHSAVDARCEPRRRAWLERTLARESTNDGERQPERDGRAAEHH